MQFIIANTFQNSLAKLPQPLRRLAKEAAFDLQLNPANPGFHLHRVERSRDPNFWSARVNDDLRIIVHRGGSAFVLCYIDHHDAAYGWAERRRLETHPSTGVAQLVEFRECAVEIAAHQPTGRSRGLFTNTPEAELLALGVPLDWVPTVQTVDEEGLLALVGYIPEEAMEALLALATGDESQEVLDDRRPIKTVDPFAHPDAQRRFRAFEGQDELRLALDHPWEKWTVFLHPVQRALVERRYGGPARISGGAGTGKTVVAMHRAAGSAQDPKSRVLLLTYSKTLAKDISRKLDILLGPDSAVRRRIEVSNLHKVARDLYLGFHRTKNVQFPGPALTRSVLDAARSEMKAIELPLKFVVSEWERVIEAWGILDWDEYRRLPRTGRGTPLLPLQRQKLWELFALVRQRLRKRGMTTWGEVFASVVARLDDARRCPYTHAIVDEAQDLSPIELRLVRALVPSGRDDLFLCSDGGQRIYRTGFPWLSVGIDVRGRSGRLRVNYRTSQQIRTRADQLLPAVMTDPEGEAEWRAAISLFEGPEPNIHALPSEEEEVICLAQWLLQLVQSGVRPGEIAIFARSTALLSRARRALHRVRLESRELTEDSAPDPTKVAVGTMHRAKGLEFRCVAVVGCDRNALPHLDALDQAADGAELDEFLEQERQLLYVACTRARDRLLISAAEPVSEFIPLLELRNSRSNVKSTLK